MGLLERKTYGTLCIMLVVVHVFFPHSPCQTPNLLPLLIHLPYIYYVQIFVQFARNIWLLTHVEETEKHMEQGPEMFSIFMLNNESLNSN